MNLQAKITQAVVDVHQKKLNESLTILDGLSPMGLYKIVTNNKQKNTDMCVIIEAVGNIIKELCEDPESGEYWRNFDISTVPMNSHTTIKKPMERKYMTKTRCDEIMKKINLDDVEFNELNCDDHVSLLESIINACVKSKEFINCSLVQKFEYITKLPAHEPIGVVLVHAAPLKYFKTLYTKLRNKEIKGDVTTIKYLTSLCEQLIDTQSKVKMHRAMGPEPKRTTHKRKMVEGEISVKNEIICID